jgi:hypothetical protein
MSTWAATVCEGVISRRSCAPRGVSQLSLRVVETASKMTRSEKVYTSKGADWLWPKPYPATSEMCSDVLHFCSKNEDAPV